MEILLWIVSGYVLLFIHLVVHELGHYSIGRFIVGIPKHRITLKLFKFPPHVALLSEQKKWLQPNDEDGDYVEAYFHYDRSGKKAFLFVMGGFLVQTIAFFILAGAIYIYFDQYAIANFIIGGSFVFNLLYITGDLLYYLGKGVPFGDTSAAYQFAPVKTILFLLLLLSSYFGFYLYIGFGSEGT